ncbi:MAG: ABC transporter substrate binding protein [Methylovulum sp.]|nr:ABC transporter substrate binding protein [Methylovulum sp.]
MSYPTFLQILPFKALAAFALAALCTQLTDTAKAQSPAKILIVNSDATVNKYRQVKEAFTLQIGAYAGRIIDFDVQQAARPELLEKLIKDESPDLIYSIGSQAYQLASQFGGGKPVLFSSVINWQRFERHDNSYGIANELSLTQELSLLRFVLPSLRRIGVIYDPRYSTERINEARSQASELGLVLIEQTVDDGHPLAQNLDGLLDKIDVLWLIADPGVLADRASVEKIFTSSSQHKKPVYTYSDAFMNYGASLVVAADTPTMGRQAANMAQAILLREPLKETVQSPAGSHITLNACQLGKLDTHYNSDALDAVNQLLECH